jgi:hypothetical protein
MQCIHGLKVKIHINAFDNIVLCKKVLKRKPFDKKVLCKDISRPVSRANIVWARITEIDVPDVTADVIIVNSDIGLDR